MLLGLTGSGKSRLGNKLSGKKEFIESDSSNSCTKKIQRALNQFNVEIIDTQGLSDTEKEDKNCLISIFKEIKENKPNILAYVQNASDKRFGEPSRKAIEEICKMFDTKSIWNHFIIVFTFAGTISKKNRENRAKNFLESILKVLTKYYENNKINDDFPIPKKLNYYFVELGDDDEYELDNDTIDALGDIMKLIHVLTPISNIKEKIIVEIKTKRNCQESLKKYERIIEDKNGNIKEIIAKGGFYIGNISGCFITSCLVTLSAIAFPILFVGMAAGGITCVSTI